MASWMDAPPTKAEVAQKTWADVPPSREELKVAGVKKEPPRFMESPLGFIGEKYDRYLSAPARAGVGKLQEGDIPGSVKAWYEQVGKDPEDAPTGKDLALKAGASDEKLKKPGWLKDYESKLQAEAPEYASAVKEKYSAFGKDEHGGSAADILGKGLDFAIDPMLGLSAKNLLTGSKVAKTAGKLDDVAKAAGKLDEVKAASQAVEPGALEKIVSEGGTLFEQRLKPNAAQIDDAVKALGGKSTPGMLSDNRNTRFLENVLHDQPTLAGESVRRSYAPIRKGLEEAAETVGQRSTFSPYEAGTEAKKSLMGKISERLDPLRASYEEIAQSTRGAPISENMSTRASGILSRQPIAKVEGTEANQIVSKYAEMLGKAKDAESVGIIVSDAKAALRDAQGPDRVALQKVISAGDRLQRRGLITAAKEGAGKEGVDVAKGLIGDIRNTNKEYRRLAQEIESVTGNAKLGSRSPGDVIRALDEAPSEQLAERLFNLKNVESLQSLKKFDPDAFEVLRQNRLNSIVNQSMSKGKIDPQKLVRNVNKLPKEAKEMLIGQQNVGKLTSMETVLNAFPEIVNPSGTARQLAWQNYLDPTKLPGQIMSEIGDAGKLMMLKAPPLPNPKGLIQKGSGVLKSPALPPAVMGTSGLMRSRDNR